MIFDTFNESLNHFRPYGIKGKPLPWKVNPRKICGNLVKEIQFDKVFYFFLKKKVLNIAVARVLKWGSYLCGFIPEKIEAPNGDFI